MIKGLRNQRKGCSRAALSGACLGGLLLALSGATETTAQPVNQPPAPATGGQIISQPVVTPGVAAPSVQRPATSSQPAFTAGQRVPAAPAQVLPQTPPNALVWDSELKEMVAEHNATNVLVTFNFTNVHSGEVVIKLVRPSCGCTTLELPPMPWRIPAGASETITATLDLRGKSGVLTKSITVDSTSGYKSLLFKVTVPSPLVSTTSSGEQMDADRLENMKLATVDRQVVFKNESCAKCHAEPGHGKMGEDLYRASCAICHDTPHRATMVPDLQALRFPTSAPYWKYWIMNGRPGSLMPAFAKAHGGPLSDEQIQSLVDYLTVSITQKGQTTAAQSGARPIGTAAPATQRVVPAPQRVVPANRGIPAPQPRLPNSLPTTPKNSGQ